MGLFQSRFLLLIINDLACILLIQRQLLLLLLDLIYPLTPLGHPDYLLRKLLLLFLEIGLIVAGQLICVLLVKCDLVHLDSLITNLILI